jgi:Predicted membrane protein
MNSEVIVRRILKPALFLAAFAPCAWLLWAAGMGALSADPLAELTHETGIWTLRFLCATLAVTPLRRLTGWNAVIRFRRMLGLYAFFYGTLHLLIYVIADRFAGLDLASDLRVWTAARGLGAAIGADVFKRPFITMGFTAWACMAPLAATSTARMIRYLGGRRWRLLHRLIYVAAITGVVHYWWSVKADIRRPEIYAVLLGSLLVIRLWPIRSGKARASARLAA